MTTLRILLTIAAVKGWFLHQLDVNTAFLHRDHAMDDMAEITFIKQHLHHLFKIKDIGELKFFLGLEVIRSKRGIMVNQKKYCFDLLKDYNLLNAKPAETPMDYTIKLTKTSGNLLQSNTEYRKLIGKLIYLTNTRLEIGYVVGRLSQYLNCPTNIHFEAALRVLRYLGGTPTKELMFAIDTNLTPIDFSDSDWGTCSDTKRSTSGYCFFIGTSIVS
ncbi:uncharacterized protein LOC107615253 [Arachis ipaensis]|uniref:uncharacterized protein LOC107615253 n=1 Tax=Arachis ipaensis TaxID=130454 RepID=UPI0007AFD1E8|nr:uncharacterized protein LOC107615253 [Arachis ipaensis]